METEKDIIITDEFIQKALDFPAYNRLILDLLEEGTTTNGDSRETMLNYTKLNIQRTSRWQKRGELTEEIVNELKSFPYKMIWLVITEGWCGDAAQSLPFMAKMADTSPNIELKLILRDEYPDIMDEFLTNGSRSIPKLIALKEDTLEIIGTWGPRPEAVQKQYMSQRADPDIENAKATENLHLWYARDKGKTIQAEFLELLRSWNIN